MIAVPAIDLREGACVQLVGGDYADERVRLESPLAAARRWTESGFRRLHVVDLDAATGRGGNASIVRRLLEETGVAVSVGGGVRTAEQAAAWLEAGADRVVAGTRAVEEPDWLAGVARAHPGRIVVAADVRDGSLVTRGWSSNRGREFGEFVASLDGCPLAAVLVTAVHREGRMAGPDVGLVEAAVAATRWPVIAAGGITTIPDLERLQRAGAAEAVLGMALYTGTLDARAVAKEFAA